MQTHNHTKAMVFKDLKNYFSGEVFFFFNKHFSILHCASWIFPLKVCYVSFYHVNFYEKKKKMCTLIILNVIFICLMVHFYRTNHCVHMLFTQKNIRKKNEIRNLYVFENWQLYHKIYFQISVSSITVTFIIYGNNMLIVRFYRDQCRSL